MVPSWLKNKGADALLRNLVPVVEGEVADGQLSGSYRGYGVQALPNRHFPIQTGGGADYASRPADVDSFQVRLLGVGGRSPWQCQSSPGSLFQGIAAQLTAGRVLRAFRPGEFKFEGVDVRREAGSAAWAGLIKRLGIPAPDATVDQAVQHRLIDAGLFDELSALRWGGHPYLPKAAFTPPGRELVGEWNRSAILNRAQPLQLALSQHMAELDKKSPGHLALEVEIGKARVPTPERFGELLEAAFGIAQINLQANPPTDATEPA